MRDTQFFAAGLLRLMDLHGMSAGDLSRHTKEKDPDGQGVGKTPIRRVVTGKGGLTLRNAGILAQAFDRGISEVIDLGRRKLDG